MKANPCVNSPRRWDLLRSLLLIVVAMTSLSHAVQARDVLNGHGLLWKIETPGYRPSYLFGTVHSDDRRVLALPLAVRERLDQADTVVIEADPADLADQRSMEAMMFTDGRRLSQVLDPYLYRRTLSAMHGSGYSKRVVDRMKPWAISTVLSVPRPRTGIFLDLYLAREGRRQGKPVQGLETVAEQLRALDGFSLAEQTVMLTEALGQLPRRKAMHEQLIRAYLDRDLAQLVDLGQESMRRGSHALLEKFKTRLIRDRNIRMVARMEPLLRKGNVFFAVGALHLPGEDGILARLEARGYRVTELY